MNSSVAPENPVLFVTETDSTNKYATRLMERESVAEGSVILTFRQTNGKGYGTNVWESEADKNLTFSLVLHPVFLHASHQFLLSQAVSLGIADYLAGETEGVSVKWPNDLLIHDRKIAGILIENVIAGATLQSSVIGVGLNVNQREFPGYLPMATSLSLATGKDYDLHQVFRGILEGIKAWYRRLQKDETAEIRKCYLERLYRKDLLSEYRSAERIFKARIRGIDAFGQLILEETSGQCSTWPFKSVEFL